VQPAIMASAENSARPVSVLVQILLLIALQSAVQSGHYLGAIGRGAIAAGRMQGSAVSMPFSAPCKIFAIRAMPALIP